MDDIIIDVLADRIKAGKFSMKKIPKEMKVKFQNKIDGVKEVIAPKEAKKEFKIYDGEREVLISKMLKDFGYIADGIIMGGIK